MNVASCKKGDGPTGSGHVSVTFGGDGSVVSAVVDQPPVRGHAGRRLRRGQVPQRARAGVLGGNIKVGKSFVVN